MKLRSIGLAIVALALIISMANIANAQQNNRQSSSGGSNHTISIGGSSGIGGTADAIGQVDTAPVPASDNPGPYRDPVDNRKIMTMTCTARNKTTTPGRIYGWNCTSTMTCSCTMTYRDDNGRLLTCAASPMSSPINGSGGDSDRGACISEADADADAQRDAFYASCATALANCPP